ncbi:hypothetical protein BH11PLA2_BH11PLA2_45120 [soil metagenome]
MIGFRELDKVLRNDPTPVKLVPLLRVGMLLAIGYGVCMGVFGLCGRAEPEYRQMIASAVKVPSLLLLTLIVTFPSLYVFNTLLGSKLRIDELARLLACAMGILVAVLAAFGPIVAFFSVTTISYPFILLLNVAFFGTAGAFGIAYLQRMLNHLVEVDAERQAIDNITTDDEAGQLRVKPLITSPTRSVFTVWMTVFVLVGSQMSWVLRPFVGSPTKEFTWFRERNSSFIEAVWRAIRQLSTEG